jgi:hypothetical protein
MRLLLLSLLALTPACSVVNGDHCGNLDGDATCTQRDPSRPHCSICVADNEGCLAEAPPASCVASTTPPDTTAAPATVTTDAPTTGPDSTTNPGTSTTLDPSTTTAGTAEPDTTTIASTTGGPVCGNDIREGEEVCDGDDLAEQTCASLLPDKWGGGKLACNACASFNDTECCIGVGQACDLLTPDEACCMGLTCEMVLMPMPGTFCRNP